MTGKAERTGWPFLRRAPLLIPGGRPAPVTIMRLLVFLLLATGLALPGSGGPVAAQGLTTGGGQSPVEVYADAGIEWNQADRQYIARVNARAVQGDTTVYGDVLVAYYEDRPDGGSEIFRMDAIGNVRIVSPDQTAYGDKAVRDLVQGIVVMTGTALRLVTPNEIITARDSLEYYEEQDMAVARGEAIARPADDPEGREREIRGDVLTAHFVAAEAPERASGTENGGDSRRIERMEAFGNVFIKRPGEIARGDRGVYRPGNDIADLWGNVRITRGQTQMSGDRAEVNFATGISRLLAADATDGGPVRALIVPEPRLPPGQQ